MQRHDTLLSRTSRSFGPIYVVSVGVRSRKQAFGPNQQHRTLSCSASSLCLGTMQFGEAFAENEAKALLSHAADTGINFFDSAEMYPVPQKAATQGQSEQILGNWLKLHDRMSFRVSTKAAGPSGQMTYIRGGPVSLDSGNITEAIDGSLRRIQTDYIDLYLLHWPDRYVPMFGDNEYDPRNAYPSAPLEDQMEALSKAKAAGKILEFGVSNETAWGLMRFCEIARRSGMPTPAVLQNAYSLLCRTFDTSLAECCHCESVKMMAYSPLAMGLLTGKYRDPVTVPETARLVKYKGRYAEAESRYGPKPNVVEAVEAYCRLAEAAGVEPYELAIRFVVGRPLVESSVIGVTSQAQLEALCRAASNGPLEADLLDAIDSVHRRYPNPAP